MKNIPIFFTFNDNYVIPAAVAFYSLINKAKNDIYYKMYVLHSDITFENQALLNDIIKRKNNADLTFVNVGDFLKSEWENGNFDGHNKSDRFHSETILKCFPTRFFPQYDKIIYSDVDIVVVDDISELYDIDLTNEYIAGVKNAFMKSSENELSHLSEENYQMFKDSYIAGGIWVMNLKKMRDDNFDDKMLQIINDDSIVKRWPDQDVINIAAQNKVKHISLNYISYPYLLNRIIKPEFVSHFSNDEMYDSLINPKIIHYAGLKPWNEDVKLAEIWWSIYYYLGLDKKFGYSYEKIMQKKSNKKIKKQRKLFFIFGIIMSLIALGLLLVILL